MTELAEKTKEGLTQANGGVSQSLPDQMLASQLLINKKQRRGPAQSPGITLWVEVDVKRRLTGSSKVTTSINPIFQTPTQSKNPTQKRPINKVFVKNWLKDH